MGGGGGHGHEPFHVPKWTAYSNYRTDAPELAEYEQRLARLGMKDPWIRNYAHLFNQNKMEAQKMGNRGVFLLAWKYFLPGLKPGLTIAATLVAIEELYSKIYYGHTSWGGPWAEQSHHGHGHGHEGGHKEEGHH